MELVTDNPDIRANDLILAKEMADTLNRHYPGHLWAVHVQGEQGMADVRNMSLSGEYGYRLRLVANYSMSEFLKRVVKAGGEILERFNLSRTAHRVEQVHDVPRDFSGRLLGDFTR
jgi:hypothetical protein